MLKSLYITLTFCLIIGMFSYAQSAVGQWITIDDKTGAEKSIVEIYVENGKLFGKVHQILEKGKEDRHCDKCKGKNKDKPVKGMIIIDGLKKDGATWKDGTILDPETGSYTYTPNDNLDGDDQFGIVVAD